MMIARLAFAALASWLILVLGLAGCGQTAPSPTPTAKAPTAATPAKPAVATPSAATPMAVVTPTAAGTTPSAAELEMGRTVFIQHCNACHPNGGRAVGPEIKGASPVVVKKVVRDGAGAMPSFGPNQISDQQLDALAAYVSTLR